MIETGFDVAFVAQMALREKQIQQSYRPIIAVHKWFARRPGTLFRALLLSEFDDKPLVESFYRAHDLHLRVVDPFMGGGTPLIEANRMGFEVIGYDINPMSYWIVQQELDSLDLHLYRRAAAHLRQRLADRIGVLYETTCSYCGTKAPVKSQNCCKRDGARTAVDSWRTMASDRSTSYLVQIRERRHSASRPLACHRCRGEHLPTAWAIW